MAFYLRQRQQVYKSILLSKLFGVKGTSKVWSNCQKEKAPPQKKKRNHFEAQGQVKGGIVYLLKAQGLVKWVSFPSANHQTMRVRSKMAMQW